PEPLGAEARPVGGKRGRGPAVHQVPGVEVLSDADSNEVDPQREHDAIAVRRPAQVADQPVHRGAQQGPAILIELAEGSDLPTCGEPDAAGADRKSTRLNSSHVSISYAVFCL